MRRVRVLHVEESGRERRLFQRGVTNAANHSGLCELEFESAATGGAALRLLAESTIDCVICNFTLPDMSGIKLLREIRSQDLSVYFVLLVERDDEKIVPQALGNGANGCWIRDEDGENYGKIVKRICNLNGSAEDYIEAEGEGPANRDYFFDLKGIAFRTDLDFRPFIVHGAFEKMTGYRAEEFISGEIGWDRIVHPADHPWRPEMPLPEDCVRREYRIIRRDGEIRWVREILKLVKNGGGKPRYVEGFVREISNGKGVGSEQIAAAVGSREGLPHETGRAKSARSSRGAARENKSAKLADLIREPGNLLLICDSFVMKAGLERIIESEGIPFLHLDYLEPALDLKTLAREALIAIYACQVLNKIEIEEIVSAMEMLPGVPILTVCMVSDKDRELEAIRSGVRGSIKDESEFRHIPNAIRAVIGGQLWFPRSIIQRMLDHYRLAVKVNGEGREMLLTQRQIEVLGYLAKGLSNREIAEALNISYATVVRHVYNIYRRMGVRNRMEALTFAARNNLVEIT